MRKGRKKGIKSFVVLLLSTIVMFSNVVVAKGETEAQTRTEDKRTTTDTFESLGGNYSLSYLLRNYGVFSFKDITGSHVVGPIVAKERVYKTNPDGNSIAPVDLTLDVANLTGNIPSFVGKIEKQPNILKPTFEMNHGYNIDKTVPALYTKSSNINIWMDVNKYKLYTTNKENSFLNPNNGQTKPGTTQVAGPGAGEILQNDNFIDFEKAKIAIRRESLNIASRPGKIVTPESTGYLKIDAGSNYIIENASNLKIVDIRFPAGYDGVTKLYPYPTFINITASTLAKSGKVFTAGETSTPGINLNQLALPKINNEDYQFFPDILVNGKQFNGSIAGQGGIFNGNPTVDFGEKMNIVWNLPNIKTLNGGLKVTKLKEIDSDIIGHIIAPDAQFYNYPHTGDFKWAGGNINGAAIVDSWYGGKREVHYWPYKDDFNNPNFKDYYIRGKKNLIGKLLGEGDYRFSLQLVTPQNTDGISSPSFVSSSNYSIEATNKSDGSITFSPITFSKAGTYVFKIKEVIGKDSKTTYDKSEYKLTATVTENTTLKSFNVVTVIDKVADTRGVSLGDTPQRVSEIQFNNEYDYTLPSTGSIGSLGYLILGMVIMISSLGILAWKKIQKNI